MALTQVQSGILADSTQTYGMKNRVINGDMRIDQRNAGASVTGNDGIYVADRWRTEASQSGKLTMQQNQGSVTPPAGFRNYAGLTSSSAYSLLSTDRFGLAQWIEGYNVSDLNFGTANASTFTLSFWVRSSLTGTFGVGVLGYDEGSAFRSYVTTYTIASANTWTYVSITIPGDTSGTWSVANGHGLYVNFNLGFGSNYTKAAGSWGAGLFYGPPGATSVVGTSGATFYITGVQLEKGSTATQFDYRPFGTELALCQRYFISYGGTTGYERVAVGVCNNTTGASVSTFLPVPMRAQPSLGYSAVGNFGVYDGGNVYAVTAIAMDQQTNQIASFQFTVASGLTTNRTAQIVTNNTTAARLTLSAEL